jgi:hypothetical protein
MPTADASHNLAFGRQTHVCVVGNHNVRQRMGEPFIHLPPPVTLGLSQLAAQIDCRAVFIVLLSRFRNE